MVVWNLAALIHADLILLDIIQVKTCHVALLSQIKSHSVLSRKMWSTGVGLQITIIEQLFNSPNLKDIQFAVI